MEDLKSWQQNLVQAIFLSELRKDIFADNPLKLAEVIVKCNNSYKVREVLDLDISKWDDTLYFPLEEALEKDLKNYINDYYKNDEKNEMFKQLLIVHPTHTEVTLNMPNVRFVARTRKDENIEFKDKEVLFAISKMIYCTKTAMIEEGILPKKGFFTKIKESYTVFSDNITKLLIIGQGCCVAAETGVIIHAFFKGYYFQVLFGLLVLYVIGKNFLNMTVWIDRWDYDKIKLKK